VVHFNDGRLPDGRARLYQAVIEWLLRARSVQRKAFLPDNKTGYGEEFAKQAFARLAFKMMTTKQGKRSTVGFDEAVRMLHDDFMHQFPSNSPDMMGRIGLRWLEFECEVSGILQELPGRQLRFWHLTFQEYLAALSLSWQVVGDESWWESIVSRHLEDAQWRETIDVLPGCLYIGPGTNAVGSLLRRVVKQYGGNDSLPTQARLAALLSRMLLPLGVYKYKPPPEIQAALDSALKRSMAIFSVEGAKLVPVKTRIDVADALGQPGDPRLASQQNNFIAVPGTRVSLGRYPVTVEEYKDFANARAYDESKWWSPEGWAARVEGKWTGPDEWDTQLLHPNRPVVGVSWFEANACCAWKSEQTGRTIRLPTEAEWAAVAMSPHGEYPWGGAEPNEELMNYRDESGKPNVGHPTPVGVYPTGAGPHGHLDLAGNVWEWTSTEDGLGPVCRGGGWSDLAGYCRSSSRDCYSPGGRWRGRGFRLAAVQ
jgi:hypothetical protein